MNKSTACFCSDRPNIAHQKVCNQWICTVKNTSTLVCGHSFHNKCLHIVRFLSEKLGKPFSCPECGPHWTKPYDLKKWVQIHWGQANILYGSCFCSKNIREYDVFFIKKNERWTSFDPDFTILPCEHIFHKTCLATIHKLMKEKGVGEGCSQCMLEWIKESELQNEMNVKTHKIERLELETSHLRRCNLDLTNRISKQITLKNSQTMLQATKVFFLIFIILNIFKIAGYFVEKPLNQTAIIAASLALTKLLRKSLG